MLVLDDREQLIRRAPASRQLHELIDMEFLDIPMAESDRDFSDVRVLMAIRERTPLPAATLARFPNLELVLQTGGHAYHVDAAEALRRGIPVALGRRAKAVRRAVPELTFLLALACLRRLPEAVAGMGRSPWSAPIGRMLANRTLGILGLGRHGRGVARLGVAFGMDVKAWARDEVPGMALEGDLHIPLLPLDELLATADVVSIHLRLSPESTGLLDEQRLRSMKPRSVLINTSRGAIIDESALSRVLVEGPIAAAGLDVFTEEPVSKLSPLLVLPNAVLTPHIGWTVEEVFEEFASIAAEQLRDYLDGHLSREELQDPDVVTLEGSSGGLAPRE